MTRLWTENEWYESLSATMQLEAEYEQIIVSRADLLFPEWHLIPFKRVVESSEGRKKPDFALIDREFRAWYVVEVEMARHDLFGHVLPQARVLRYGNYTRDHAEYLAAQLAPEMSDAALSLLYSTPPNVSVIVDRPMPRWDDPLRAIDVQLGVIEVFRSNSNNHSLRLDGDLPERPASESILCVRHEMLLRLWQVSAPVLLPISEGEELLVDFDGVRTAWRRQTVGSQTMIRAVAGNPLGDLRRVRLEQVGNSRWEFRRA